MIDVSLVNPILVFLIKMLGIGRIMSNIFLTKSYVSQLYKQQLMKAA